MELLPLIFFQRSSFRSLSNFFFLQKHVYFYKFVFFKTLSYNLIARLTLLVFFFKSCLLPHFLHGQNDTNYRFPLRDFKGISGTFGEMREPYLHPGIDFRANLRTEVVAVADGYVTRIKVGPGGYGKVLYIQHRDGHLTVYGHLDEFMSSIEDSIGKLQTRSHRFAQEFFADSLCFRLQKGQLIGYSGNTGISAGPHLHFEVIYKGQAINPSKVKSTSGSRLSGKELARFKAAKDEIERYRKNVPNQIKVQ